MPASSNRSLALAAIVACCLPIGACKKAAPGGADTSYADEPSGQQRDPLGELEALEDRMRELDLPVARRSATAKGGPAEGEGAGAGEEALSDGEAEAPLEADATASPPAPDDDGQRCVDLCDLSDAICGLEDRICELSKGHGQESAYGDACRRAVEDCDVATDACEGCGG